MTPKTQHFLGIKNIIISALSLFAGLIRRKNVMQSEKNDDETASESEFSASLARIARCLRPARVSMLINLYLKSLIHSCYVFISHFCVGIMRIFVDPDEAAESQRGHKTINENRKANLDNEKIFPRFHFAFNFSRKPKAENLKHQKILIDIFNSPVGSIMSRLRRTRARMWQSSRDHRKNNRCGKEETCFIQINSFCISNETNLDFCSHQSHKKFVFAASAKWKFKISLPEKREATMSAVPAEHLSGNNVSWCRK
jgi:hypothetical protein